MCYASKIFYVCIPDWMDLWICDRGCGDWLQDAQSRVALRLLRDQARRLPWLCPNQSHGSSPPGTALGHWFCRDILLPKQWPSCRFPDETVTARSLPQRRDLSIHLHLLARLLLSSRALSLQQPVHRPVAEHHVPSSWGA